MYKYFVLRISMSSREKTKSKKKKKWRDRERHMDVVYRKKGRKERREGERKKPNYWNIVKSLKVLSPPLTHML